MNFKLRKTIIIPVLAIFCLIAFVLSVTMSLGKDKNSAQAASADLAFTAEAGIYDVDSGAWTPYLDGVSDEFISFRFLLTSPNKNPSITQFSYITGTSDAAVRAGTVWLGEENEFLKADNMQTFVAGGEQYLLWTFPESQPYDRYIKFRASAETTTGTGQPITEEYVNNNIFHIIYNPAVNPADIAIQRVDAYYYSGTSWKPYSTVLGSAGNIWVSTQLRFDLISQGDTPNKKFDYSIDGISDMESPQKQWHPANGDSPNICIIQTNLNGPMHFRVTDQSGVIKGYRTTDTNGQSIHARMDIVRPEIEIRAQSTRTNSSGENEIYDYNSKNYQWSYNDITYIITPVRKGQSPVRYEYKIVGVSDWTALAQNAGGGAEFYTLPLNKTTQNINFRAISDANKESAPSGRYDGFIDKQQPVVSITAKDKLNTVIRSFGTAAGSGYRVGYASDSLSFVIYNRTPEGTLIFNESDLKYTYKYTYLDDDGELQETEYSNMAENTDAQNYKYYTFTDAIYDPTPINRRVYTFRLESRSGLYDEKSFTGSILYSDFSVSLDLVSRIENEKGWANAPIPVYINAPVMDKYTFAYRISGTGYENFEKTFVWAADGSGDGDEIVKDVSADYADLDENDPGYLPAGMAKFRIFLSTSVERRYFKIYAYNAAQVKSKNEVNTPEIRLDLATPDVDITAFVQQSLVAIASGAWANGNIELTLDSKTVSEISLSGIECELMVDNNIPERALQSLLDGDGLPLGKFKYLVEIPEGQAEIFTRTFMFRLTSGSGLQNFVYFDARIDKRDIQLSYVYDNRNNESLLIHDPENPQFTATTQPVCKDVELTFKSNHNGHFNYWYRIDSAGAFTKGTGDSLLVAIEPNAVGEITVDFYLESYAINFEGQKKTTSPYTVKIPFNCSSINITAAIQPQAPGYNRDVQNGWIEGPLSILINLPAGESYADYTYGIIILYNKTPVQFYAENGLTELNQKSDIYEYAIPVSLINGAFDFWGVDEHGVPRFSDPTSTTNKCFYTGNIIVFAFNAAKYSSNPVPIYSTEIKIDNSTPDVEDMIGELNGEIDDFFVYNNETITLRNPEYTDRAPVYYYYFIVTEETPEPSDLPTETQLNGWQRMLPGDTVQIVEDETAISTSYYLFARNTLDNISSHTGDKYTFRVDSFTPEFIINYPEGEGSPTQTTIDGEVYNIFTFTWTEEINIEFTTNSKTGVYYWYSIDNRQTWIKYNEEPSTEGSLTFRFNQDIKKTMFFRLTNQAGSVVVHDKPAVVQIDTRRPDFTLETYVGGNVYDGGGFGSIDVAGSLHGLALTDTSGQWASSSVSVVIRIDPALRNPSTVNYQYLVVSANGETQYTKTPSDIVINNAITFTTDRMDNFGKNNDAILVVQAICPANGKKYTQAIRIKVDKVIPEFKLNGEVYISDTSNQTKQINSGEWTNQEEVRVSIERTNVVPNVSNVRIVYYRDGSSLENQWPMDSVTGTSYGMVTSTRSETLRVVARTDSGLVYERVFEINIDTVPPQIESGIIVPSVTNTPNTYYIDQPITFREENLKTAQYIVRRGETIGFPLSQGHIIATNSVDNSEQSQGYVKIIIEDLAGNRAELEFYMIPFLLNINNLTLSQKDLDTVDRYEEDLAAAKGIDDSRRAYFENLIIRLRDRENTLRQEIAGFQSYIAGLSQKASYELKSDYREMDDYLTTYRNYEYYGHQWIQEAIVQGEYYAYFQKLQEEHAILAKEMARVTLVENNTKKLPAINVVKVTDYNNVLQVYDAYLDLSPDQKSVYATTLYNKLMTLKRKCENMLLQDTDSGIKIEGNLAPGARIEVTPYPNTVELYNNAQATILNTVAIDKPRTVVSINRVSLTGAASQTETGEILVTLPIPEEYYNYVRFSVYRLSPDGTVTEINGVEIQGDGKSVVFSANNLDTYVLATKANIAVRETNTDVYGTLGGIEVDTQMLNYIAFTTIGVFVVLIVVITITGLRRRRFLNHYNKAHKRSLYKKGLQNIPKGNKPPVEHPFNEGERVKTPQKPIM